MEGEARIHCSYHRSRDLNPHQESCTDQGPSKGRSTERAIGPWPGQLFHDFALLAAKDYDYWHES